MHITTQAHLGRRLVGVLFVVGVAAWLLAVGPVDALKAAGAFDDQGSAIAGIGQFVDHIKGNIVWALSVLSGVVVIGVGAMFLSGHSRAGDYAIKALVGFLIVASGSGIVA
jgi:hypothetical protein